MYNRKGVNMQRNALILGCITALVMLSLAPVAAADDVSDLKAQIERLNARLEKMESQKSTQIEKEELAKMMKEILDDAQAAPALPAWMKDLKFSGMFRLRGEMIKQRGERGPYGANFGDLKTINRIRMLLLFGFTKTWWDNQMEVGFQLSSGDAAPNAAHQTMDTDFSKKDVWISMMYAKYKPNWAKGLEIAGGKLPAPFRTKTLITWSPVANPEGIYIDYQAPFFGDFKPYGQIGFWVVNDNGVRHATVDTTVRDTEMLSISGGYDWRIADAVDWFLGATYYKYYNIDASNGGWVDRYGDDGQWQIGSTTALGGIPCADYGMVELTTKVGWKFDFLPAPFQKWETWFSWVRNTEDDYNVWKNPPATLGGLGADRHFQSDPNAYAMGIKVGENKKKGDFSVGYTFFYVEYSSVVSIFADPDILYANNQGHMLQMTYNIDDFLTVSGTMALEQPIHTADNAALNSTQVAFPHSQDITSIFRVDLTWKF